MPRTPAEALERLIAALDRLEIPYEVAGSVASSAHGIPRTTLDVDLVVDLAADKIDEFAADLRWDFYADANLIRESFARGRAANLIHLVTAWKFDLFPPGKTNTARPSSDADCSGSSKLMERTKLSALSPPGRIRSCENWNGIARAEKAQRGNGTICSASA